ncbi:hypothetical protein ARMSODRAFT_981664 [Armillaria solidipes]|uniref:Uncharacterized protein n=1 Tax=Armillaria solidipes TaxID=1076256 RepID=A0A2H3B9Q5_9AGAR|nr:hypothetical protein ARMSODRAFT_981664 [Armillaria solidipes]
MNRGNVRQVCAGIRYVGKWLKKTLNAARDVICCGDQREESSCEYEYAANAVDNAKTFDVEGSATESPPLATPETASWEAQRRELDMEQAVQVMDDVDEILWHSYLSISLWEQHAMRGLVNSECLGTRPLCRCYGPSMDVLMSSSGLGDTGAGQTNIYLVGVY